MKINGQRLCELMPYHCTHNFGLFLYFFACIAIMEWGLVIYNRVFFRNYRKSLINAAFVRNRSRRPAISNRICTCTAARGRSNVIFAPADSPNTPTWRTICFCIPVSTYFPALYFTIIFQGDVLLRIKTKLLPSRDNVFGQSASKYGLSFLIQTRTAIVVINGNLSAICGVHRHFCTLKKKTHWSFDTIFVRYALANRQKQLGSGDNKKSINYRLVLIWKLI